MPDQTGSEHGAARCGVTPVGAMPMKREKRSIQSLDDIVVISDRLVRGRWLIPALGTFGLVVIIGAMAWRGMYPHGRRPCTLRCMHLVLATYAHEHEGWFPDSTNGPMAALQLLYPDYCPVGRELAGVSGDVEAVVRALRDGKPLGEDVSSWRYITGLREDDDPKLALLWEARSGLHANGRRSRHGSRAVLLLGGEITNVVESDWAAFMDEQVALAASVRQKRKMRP